MSIYLLSTLLNTTTCVSSWHYNFGTFEELRCNLQSILPSNFHWIHIKFWSLFGHLMVSFSFFSFCRLTLFGVFPDNGTVYVKNGTGLDREHKDSYSATLQANDSAGNVGTTVLEFTILDINDQKPEFLRNPYEFFIIENEVLERLVEVSFLIITQTSLDNCCTE